MVSLMRIRRRMNGNQIRNVWKLFFGLYLLPICDSYLQIVLSNVGYSYSIPLVIHNIKIPVIVDTGNNKITLLNTTLTPLLSPDLAYSDDNCLYLSEDSTNIQFIGNSNENSFCAINTALISLGDIMATETFVNYSIADILSIDNPYLHNWTSTYGDLGMAYSTCTTSNQCNPTPFERILLNLTIHYNSSSGNTYDKTDIDYNEEQQNKGQERHKRRLVNIPEQVSFIPDDTQYYYGGQAEDNSPADPSSFSNSSFLIFGLDLQPLHSKTPSTMQIGYIKSNYSSNLLWVSQPVEYPVYHEFTMYHPKLCGISLLGNYSNSFTTIVDTGSVCLSFPSEMYDSFASWLNVSTNTSISIDDLPPFSFSVSQTKYDQFYIPLESLILPETVFIEEDGVPQIIIDGKVYRLCVIRGPSIKYFGTVITIGTLGLHSIYFAADFSSNSVGLASKLSPSQTSSLAARVTSGKAQCNARAICKGDETYDPNQNICNSPTCSDYYFTRLNTDTATCYYSTTAYGFGVAFVLAVTIMEVLSYFTLQYSASEAIESNSAIDSTRYARSRIDSFTYLFGKVATAIMDFFIIDVMSWVESRNATGVQNAEDNHVRPFEVDVAINS